MVSQLGVLVSWRDLTGDMPTLEMLDTRLAPFRMTAVLLGISRLSARLRTWQNEPDFDADRLFASRYLPSYSRRIKRICESRPDRLIFTRVNLLFVAKRACCVCPLEGRDIVTVAEVEEVLSCCLMASDLLLEGDRTSSDGPIDCAAGLLPFANYTPRDSHPTDLARSLLLIEEIAPQFAAQDGYIDLASAFTVHIGSTPRRFCQLVIASSVRFLADVETQLNDPGTAFLLTPQNFQNTNVPQDVIREVLKRLSIAPAALRAQAERDKLGADFLVFQKQPLVEFAADNYMCPDPGFLLDKACASLFWTLHEATGRNQDLLAYWGRVVERYAQWLFAKGYMRRGQVLPSPQFTRGGQACDVCLVERSDLLLIEVKASVLTVQAKYGFDPDILRLELEKKAIKGEDGERKGVEQLRHNVQQFLGGEDIDGVSRKAIKKIYPILVFLDHGFTAPFLNQVYNAHFDNREMRLRYGKSVTPIFSLTLSDLENVLPYTNACALSEILDSYHRANRNMYGELSLSSVPLLRGRPPTNDLVRERFRLFDQDLERALFRT